MGHDTACVLRQDVEQFIFCTAELRGTPIDGDLLLVKGDEEITGCEERFTWRDLLAGRVAAQQDAGARQQFFDAKWLDDKVVRAYIEVAHMFILITIITQHEDGGV